MKLTDIKTFVVGNPPPGNGGRYFVFVKLSTDGNVHGVGEAYCVPFHPDLVARMLIGRVRALPRRARTRTTSRRSGAASTRPATRSIRT